MINNSLIVLDEVEVVGLRLATCLHLEAFILSFRTKTSWIVDPKAFFSI